MYDISSIFRVGMVFPKTCKHDLVDMTLKDVDEILKFLFLTLLSY